MTKLEIEQVIEELKKEDLTFSNARNLASLYIIYNNIEKSNTEQSDESDVISHTALQELTDILPAYKNYCMLKRKYQLNEISEDCLPPAMKFVSQELYEFIKTLYSNTYLRKERSFIEEMLKNLISDIDSL